MSIPIPRIVKIPGKAKAVVCQATVIIYPGHSKEWRKEMVTKGCRSYKRIQVQTYDQCTHLATTIIDGHHLCSRHAGMLALQAVVEGKPLDSAQLMEGCAFVP